MTVLTSLQRYSDDDGNVVEYDGPEVPKVWIRFGGRNNRVRIAADAKLTFFKAFLDSNNSTVEIGSNTHNVPRLSITVRAGEDSTVRLGDDVSSTGNVFVSATEGTEVSVGRDVMFSTNNEVRADDAHAIYDVDTRRRVNVSRSIHIGDHVWLGRDVVLLGGARIGEGSVIGYRSIVTGRIPNNCVAVGIPARVARRNIAWERPHLATAPYYRPDADTLPRSRYWRHTESDLPVLAQASRVRRGPAVARLRRAAGRVLRRLGLRR